MIMDKIIISALVILGIYLIVRYKPPLLVNSVESVILILRDLGLALTYPKYFRNDPVNYEALPFESVLRGVKGNLEIHHDTWTFVSQYKDEKRSTSIIRINEYDPKKPSLIYHHGAGSTHPVKDFNLIFGNKFKVRFNVFVVWAQYHKSKKEYLTKSVDSFLHHQETFAGSVLAYEEIVRYHKSQSNTPVVATGSSMGGIVSSLHAFYFGSADYYFPLVAYPNVGEIFLGDVYKYAVSDHYNKKKNGSYTSSFTIKDFDHSLTTKVFPIIGGKDKVVPSEKALQFWESRGFTVTQFPYGHFTSAVAKSEIRELILDKVEIR